MRKQALLCLLACLCVALCGCGIKRDANGRHAYLLNVNRPDSAFSAATNNCLTIRSCRVANPYAGRNFIYKLSDVRYEQDFYNLYLTTPDKQAHEILTLWFRDSQLFSCSDQADQTSTKWTLSPRIDVLCVDFQQMEKPQATVQMYFEFDQFNQKNNRLETIHQKVYTARTPLPPTPTAPEITKAMSRSLEKIIAELENDIIKIIEK